MNSIQLNPVIYPQVINEAQANITEEQLQNFISIISGSASPLVILPEGKTYDDITRFAILIRAGTAQLPRTSSIHVEFK